jgi:hypothetical protein
MKAAQNSDFLPKFLPTAFDTLTMRRRNYPPSVQHMALDAWGNSYYQAVLSHPAEY